MSNIPEVRFRIEPINKDYKPSDDRWIDQVNVLVADLERGVGKVHKDVEPVEGTKGGLEVLKLVLDSIGAIKAAGDMFNAWLSRDQSREIVLSIECGDETQTIRVSANRMDKDDIRNFMETALQKASSHGRSAL